MQKRQIGERMPQVKTKQPNKTRELLLFRAVRRGAHLWLVQQLPLLRQSFDLLKGVRAAL